MMAGKRDEEKNTPEKIHMGSMTRFIRPDAASMVRARDEIKRPSAENDNEVSTHKMPNCHSGPRKGTPKASRANPRKAATSTISMMSRESRKDVRYCHRGMGE